MDGSAYRDCSDLVAAELSRLLDTRRSELESTPKGRQSVYVRRWGRITFGVVGTLGAAATAATTALGQGYGAHMLLGSWLLALLGWVLARELASRRLLDELNKELRLSGDAFSDTARLRERGPGEKEADLSRLRDQESIAWPLTAVALLGPLTIHLLLALFFGTGLEEFEGWMALSGIVVGLSHLYMVRVAWRYPEYRHPWKGLMWAIAAVIPGVFALCLGAGGPGGMLLMILGFPVVGGIALVTGGILIWGAYEPLGELLDRERALAYPPSSV